MKNSIKKPAFGYNYLIKSILMYKHACQTLRHIRGDGRGGGRNVYKKLSVLLPIVCVCTFKSFFPLSVVKNKKKKHFFLTPFCVSSVRNMMSLKIARYTYQPFFNLYLCLFLTRCRVNGKGVSFVETVNVYDKSKIVFNSLPLLPFDSSCLLYIMLHFDLIKVCFFYPK